MSKNMLTFSPVYEHWQESICKRLQRCEHLSKHMLAFSPVLNRSTFLCDTVEPSFRFICVLPCSQKRSVPRGRTDRLTIKGFRAQPPGKPVRMRIKTAAEVRTFVKTYCPGVDKRLMLTFASFTFCVFLTFASF